MKTLILSCSTGQGHNSCASAIKEYFELQGQTCCIVDGLSLLSGFTSAVISQGHAFIYKSLPGFFRWGYSHAEKHPELFDEKSAVYRFLGSARKKLLQLIEEGGYDCVICTHVFTALMLKNAVKPGIDCIEDGTEGKLIIEFGKEEEFLVFNIYNNGPLIQSKEIEKLTEKVESGYGIRNIMERILLYYGEDCGISVKTTEDGYTCFTVRIYEEIIEEIHKKRK